MGAYNAYSGGGSIRYARPTSAARRRRGRGASKSDDFFLNPNLSVSATNLGLRMIGANTSQRKAGGPSAQEETVDTVGAPQDWAELGHRGPQLVRDEITHDRYGVDRRDIDIEAQETRQRKPQRTKAVRTSASEGKQKDDARADWKKKRSIRDPRGLRKCKTASERDEEEQCADNHGETAGTTPRRQAMSSPGQEQCFTYESAASTMAGSL
ncbi:hypothetical protein DFH06DRAFT_1145220 [Mycena polygramma]|nr:hypothetical protein DFH06DRAFT_1145220 [Mycena polygramma]